MLPDAVASFFARTGPSFVPSWSNGDIAVATLVSFAACFVLASILAAEWPVDAAFLSLVIGGVLVSWPTMIALSMAAVVVAIVVSVAHKLLFPERAARIAAEADRKAAAAVATFTRETGLDERMKERKRG